MRWTCDHTPSGWHGIWARPRTEALTTWRGAQYHAPPLQVKVGCFLPLEALSPGIRMGEVLQLTPQHLNGGGELPQTEMACQGTYVVEVRGRLAKVSSLLQCESWALNSGHQAWHQAPFSIAPTHSAFSGNHRQSFSASL